MGKTSGNGEASSVDPKIEQLQLADIARSAAYQLKAAHPNVVFTSGRRTLARQAAAMAENIVLKPRWIERTYAQSPLRDRCQEWVDSHPEITREEDIAAGLIDIFKNVTTEELNRFSKHLSGMAFDVKPMPGFPEVIATIRSLPGLKRFLEKEGGLIRWHAEF